MLRRKIQAKIADYLENGSNKILVLNGARQIGKSYIIRHEGQERFANYIEIDLIEDKKGDRVFEGTRGKDDFYLRLSTIAGDRMKGIPAHQYFWWKRKYGNQEVAEGFLPESGAMLPAAMGGMGMV